MFLEPFFCSLSINAKYIFHLQRARQQKANAKKEEKKEMGKKK